MTTHLTEQAVQTIVNAAVDDMAEIVGSFAQQIADKFGVVDVRFDMLEAQLAIIAERLEKYDDQSIVLQSQVSMLQSGLVSLRQFVRRATKPVAKLQPSGRKGWLAPAHRP
jgi:phage terminase large subunit-like protein